MERNILDKYNLAEIVENRINLERKFVIDDTHIRIRISENAFYNIKWKKLNNSKDLIEWINHLSTKNWFSMDIQNYLIVTVNEKRKLGLNVYLL